MSKLLTLEEWARRRYEKPPSLKTLRRWVHEAKIVPIPKKEGRSYLVKEGAEYRNWNEPSETQYG
jgi:predicted site-specific integrase-resolvase